MIDRKELSLAILRWSLALVFLYFGFQQIISPDSWSSLVPEFFSKFMFTTNNLVVFNGIMEITLGIFLILGVYTKFSSLILAIHLLFISISLGFSPVGVRDFGLAMATLVVFLYGEDKFTLDWGIRNRSP